MDKNDAVDGVNRKSGRQNMVVIEQVEAGVDMDVVMDGGGVRGIVAGAVES